MSFLNIDLLCKYGFIFASNTELCAFVFLSSFVLFNTT